MINYAIKSTLTTMVSKNHLDNPVNDNKGNKAKAKHDQLFRKSMEIPIVRYEFLNNYLEKTVLASIDTTTLKLEKETYIEQDLRSTSSDVIFSAKFNNNNNTKDDGYIFLLLEHQSTSDHMMAFRLFKYMIRICDRYMTLHPKAKHLPLVYPLVIYNGTKRYNAPLNIWELFSNKELAKSFWAKDYQLVNVHKISDVELKKKVWCGILLFFLKHIHERQLLKRWQQIADILPELTKVTIGYDYIGMMLHFTLPFIDNDDKMMLDKVLTDNINKEKEGEIMGSITQTWLDEGIAIGKVEGEEIGKAAIAKRLLLKKYSIAEISEITGLSVADIQKFQSY